MKVVIEGCGWLGNQIGKALKSDGHEVWGSYRSEENKAKLETNEILPFYHDYDSESQYLNEIYENTDLLIIASPPLWKEKEKQYAQFIGGMVEQIPTTAKVIFTSSIGVYPHETRTYDETFVFMRNQKNRVVLRAEEELKYKLEDRLTVLRLGGLIGPNRHPIKFLQGRQMKDDGSCPVSLIHSGDIINAVRLIIEKRAFGMIFNLVFPTQVSKKEYYIEQALRLGLTPPVFNDEMAIRRKVEGDLIVRKLGFSYTFDIHKFRDRLR